MAMSVYWDLFTEIKLKQRFISIQNRNKLACI